MINSDIWRHTYYFWNIILKNFCTEEYRFWMWSGLSPVLWLFQYNTMWEDWLHALCCTFDWLSCSISGTFNTSLHCIVSSNTNLFPFLFWLFSTSNMRCLGLFYLLFIQPSFLLLCPHSSSPFRPFRHEQSRSAWAGGEGLPDGLCPGLPHLAPWTDAAVLEAGGRWEAHVWVPPVLPGGLLHRHRAAVPAGRKPVTSHV